MIKRLSTIRSRYVRSRRIGKSVFFPRIDSFVNSTDGEREAIKLVYAMFVYIASPVYP